MIIFAVTSARPRVLTELDLKKLAKYLSSALRLRSSVTIGVRFVSLAEIQALNKAFRKKNKPTDVLSFSVEESEGRRISSKKNMHEPRYWGDLAICSEYAKEEARRRGLPLREELLRLLTHGGLHLAGYDHATEEEEFNMFSLQERIVDQVV